MPDTYYEQDGISIYHGDCREILPDIGGVALTVTSPPYNCGIDYGGHDDAQSLVEYFAFIESAFHCNVNAMLPGGHMAWNVPSWIGSRDEQIFAFDEYKGIFDQHAPFSDAIIWAKPPPNGAAWGNYPTSPRIRANHEWVLVYRMPGASLGKSDISWADWSRLTQSVWTINPTLPFNNVHKATFPIELPRRLISLFTAPGAVVCDPFMGTGTTLEAAKQLGRRGIGIELNEQYCEIAANRLAQGVLFGIEAAHA